MKSSMQRLTLIVLSCVLPAAFPALSWSEAPRPPPRSGVERIAADPPDSYATYYNGRFGHVVDYPDELFTRRDHPLANGAGQRFFSADHSSFFVASGRFNVDNLSKIDDILKESEQLRQKDGWSIIRRDQGANWCVLVGTRGDRSFYQKMLLTHKKQVIDTLTIEFPSRRKTLFAPIISHMAKSFRGTEAYGLFD